jgi:hypothetical protein
VAGTHYFLQYSYRNTEGDSPASDMFEVVIADYPQAPTVPSKVDTSSSLTSIYLEWEQTASTQVNVIGYELWMDQGSNGLFHLEFDGKNQPGITSHMIENLETARAYTFRIRALNFNGAGPFSNDVIYYICLPPE